MRQTGIDYRARITVGRYIRASSFASDLGKLKAFRGESAGPSLLESLEELRPLRPRMRLHWPDPVARRIWQETRRREVPELQDPVEPDGPRMDAAADLWNALQDAGMRSLRGDTHPFDAPKPEWLEFLKRPEQQTIVPHRERRVRVSSDAQPNLHDSDNVQDFYSSWQLLTAIELADIGVHIRINMADEDIARRVREDIISKRWPGGRYLIEIPHSAQVDRKASLRKSRPSANTISPANSESGWTSDAHTGPGKDRWKGRMARPSFSRNRPSMR